MESSESECASSWLELAPIEVISVIASYLEARDIAQCCAASSTLREVFSDNSIWRPRCNKELAEYLTKTPCKVKPMFVNPAMEESSLSPLPEWRISYMRENHLWNNWRMGRFIKESIKDSYPSADFHSFYSNDVVIARYRDRVTFLDVKGYPASDVAQRYLGTELSFVSDFKTETAGNGLIVFMSGSGVQVFQLDLNLNTLNLKHTFFFENSQTSHQEQSIFSNQNVEFRGIRLVVGHLFIGLLEGKSTLHIWNLEKGVKLKEEHCFVKHCPCPVLEIQGSDTMHLIVAVGKATEKTKIFMAYSLAKLKFLSFEETQDINSEYLVHKDFVAIRFEGSFTVFNYQTANAIATLETDSLPKTIKSNLLFRINGHIKVFNLNKNTSSILPVTSVLEFEVLGDKFLQICKHEWGSGNIWEFNETYQQIKPTTTRFYFESCAYFLNRACTRYIVREGVGMIMHFW